MSGPRGGLAKCGGFALIASRRFLITSAGLFGHSTVWPSGRHLYCGSRDLPKDFSFAIFLAVFSIAYPSVSVLELKAQESCEPPVAGGGRVANVRDGRTVLLTDGREVRLAVIEVVDSSRGARVVAVLRSCRSQSTVDPGNTGRAGPGAGRSGDKACADILLRSERVARAARRGLWADPNFAPLQPEHLNRIAAARGQFALVEGKVLSVRESGATIYLNFGRRL